MDKLSILKDEISLIKDASIREFTESAVDLMPDYIFTIPASSSGKYHPNYALGDGGLIRHVKAAVKIAVTLFGNETITGTFDVHKRDLVISALILHDGTKSGIPKSSYTVEKHPTLMVEHLQSKLDIKHSGILNEVAPLIASHMGQWNTDRSGREVNPKPKSATERFVHLCDYLASRKFLEVNFNAS